MQFSNTILIAAMTVSSVIALPGGGSGSGGSSGGSGTGANACPTTNTQLCCDTTATLVGLTCVLSSLLGSTCDAQTICCVNDGGSQTCTNTDGTTVSVPITIGITL